MLCEGWGDSGCYQRQNSFTINDGISLNLWVNVYHSNQKGR